MFTRKLNSLKRLQTQLGITGLLKFIWNRYVISRNPKAHGWVDIFSIYDFLTDKPYGDVVSFDPSEPCTINWVIPGFFIGSGGHLNIFRLILQLEHRGYQCRVIIMNGYSQFNSVEGAREVIRNHFFPINAEVSFGTASLKPANITVATSWLTAYPVKNFRSTDYRCYFVQDYEPYFYAHGSEYYFAEATYQMGFIGITAGGWLAQKLASEYGMQTTAMGFSYDRNLYRPYPRSNAKLKQVFFYARPVTPRRGFELGLLALNLVAQHMPDVEFVLAGWDASTYHIPFKHKNAGTVAVKDLAELYSQCDVALVLSLTNLSLLPLELMASGCPVVSNRGENVEWLLNNHNSVLADLTPEALSNEIISLLQDDQRRKQLIEAGLAFAANTSWDTEAEKVADYFNTLVAYEMPDDKL